MLTDTNNNILAFTLCSNNYLSQAKTLGDSLVKHNPDIWFFIGLVDLWHPEIDYSIFEPFQIIPVEEIGIDGYADMCERYDIVEFNTAVKPFYFSYLIKKFNPTKIYYFDPDIVVFDSLQVLHNELETNNIILTPHILNHSNNSLNNYKKGAYSIGFDRVFEENFIYWELHTIKFGLYNLGFIGLSNTPESLEFLKWWQYRTKKYCDTNVNNELFVDQLWVSLAPLLFDKVKILKHYGLNVAHWNLHERHISKHEGQYLVNGKEPLVFFHYSSYNPLNQENLTKYDKAVDLKILPELEEIVQLYKDAMIKNKFEQFVVIPCQLKLRHIQVTKKHNFAYRALKKIANKILK
jgi:hypothetical protein